METKQPYLKIADSENGSVSIEVQAAYSDCKEKVGVA